MTDKYLEQYERMRRSYDRFREINSRLADKVSSDYEDDVYAFFAHCYHLKDWIKNDHSVKSRMPNLGADIEQFINENEALSLCADVCNSLKRLELDRSHSSELRIFGRKRYHSQLNIGSKSSIRLQWPVQRNNKPPIDAFELAGKCIADVGQIPSTFHATNFVRNSSTPPTLALRLTTAEEYCREREARAKQWPVLEM